MACALPCLWRPTASLKTRGCPHSDILSNFLFALLVHMCSQLHVDLIVSLSPGQTHWHIMLSFSVSWCLAASTLVSVWVSLVMWYQVSPGMVCFTYSLYGQTGSMFSTSPATEPHSRAVTGGWGWGYGVMGSAPCFILFLSLASCLLTLYTRYYRVQSSCH